MPAKSTCRHLLIAGAALSVTVATLTPAAAAARPATGGTATATPIKHLVVLFQENVPFDHYFGVYPHAANPPGEPAFTAKPGTPALNGYTPQLLTNNPNSANPQRNPRNEPRVCGSNHDYLAEQKAMNNGLMNRFVEETGSRDPACSPTHVMNYYDGNTVTALWNYAQNFALNDNSFGTTFGPSHIGAVNLVSGQNHGAVASLPTTKIVDGTTIANIEPTYDDCPKPPLNVHFTGRNIGDLLNDQQVSWGWFSGGFRATSRLADGSAVCAESHTTVFGKRGTDYDSGNEAFNYYASTSNPHHLAPSSLTEIGHDGRANHQYDLTDFYAAANAGKLPAVSFLKAGGYEQGGCSCSGPLDEQNFLASTVNHLQSLPSWKDTAVVVAWDDSDGGYDHVAPPRINTSQTAFDALTGPGLCGTATPVLGGYQGRCGYGARQPLLVISPYSRPNSVNHALTDQTSIIRFVEDNWLGGRRIGDGSYDGVAGSLAGAFDFAGPHRAGPFFVNPDTGVPTAGDGRAAPRFVEATNLIASGPLTAGQPNTVLVEVANRTAQPSYVTVTVAAPPDWAVGRSSRTIPAFSSAIVAVLVIPPRTPTTATLRAVVRAPGRTVYGVETVVVTTIAPA
ncbi:MAG: alkaline phosphatase family protein [Pseudonocardiales bacterium]